MLIRLCWAIGLYGATVMGQNANHAAHVAIRKAAEAASTAANTTRPPLTGNPNIDYKWDPNLPIELHGYDLSNYPFYNGLPDDLLDPSVYNFTCDDRLDGFYASVHHQCQVYHNCLFGSRYDFLCANYTVFDQKNFICHYVSLVDCAGSAKHFDRNEELYVTTTTTTERPSQPQIIYIERPARPRPGSRPRPRPFFNVKNRRPEIQAPPSQPIDEEPVQPRPAGGRRPSNRRPAPAYYDDYYDDYNYYDYGGDYYGDYYYDDEPVSTTTTTTTPPPPIRRKRPQRTRLGGRRPGAFARPNFRPRTSRLQDDARPIEQDIRPVEKDSQNIEPELRKPTNRRRPGPRPNKPSFKNTTPADPFSDYYDDNIVSEEPSSTTLTTTSTTTPTPVIPTQRQTRPRIRPRKPEPTTEETLVPNDQEPDENTSQSTVTVRRDRKPINGRRPFRPAPKESSPEPERSGEPVVNARQPFRPRAEESTPKEEVSVREPLGSGRRTQGPRFPSRRKPTTETQPEEPVNEEVIIEEDPPLAPGIEVIADGTLQDESHAEEIVSPTRPNTRRRVRIGGLRRPQRQSQSDYEY